MIRRTQNSAWAYLRIAAGQQLVRRRQRRGQEAGGRVVAEAHHRDERDAKVLRGEFSDARGELAAEGEDEGGAGVDFELGEGVGDGGDLLWVVWVVD